MLISFKTKKLEKQLTDYKELRRKFGSLAEKVNLRIKQLKSADNLKVMETLPAANCHELKGDLKGSLAVDISANYRLIFEPDHDPVPRKADSGLNWSEVNQIIITQIVDYH